jgi:hypothetical protein
MTTPGRGLPLRAGIVGTGFLGAVDAHVCVSKSAPSGPGGL